MGIWKNYCCIFIVVGLCSSKSLMSQTKLYIYDKESGATLPNAHVCFESLDKKSTSYSLSDKAGVANKEIRSGSVVSVSYIGYQTLLDTVYPGQTKNIYLEPSIYGVDELVVTAQFSPKKVDQSIYKVKVIDNSIVEKKGATNLSDLISNELNFSPVRDAALGSSVRIQGLGGEHVKVLVDGVPIIGRQNGILDLSQINVASIDHIEVIEGPMSVVYGSNAMAGVINIITKENKRQSFQSGIEAYYETVGVYDFDANFSINKEKNSLGLSLGRYFFGGYSEVDTSRAKEWDPKLQYNLEGYYALNLRNTKFKLTSNYFDEELRDNGNLNSDLNFEGALDYYHFTRRWDNKLEITKKMKAKQNFTFSSAYSTYNKIKNKYLNDLVHLDKSIVDEASANDTTIFKNYFSRGTYSNENIDGLTFQGGYEFSYETAVSQRLEDMENIGEAAGFLSVNYIPLEKLNFQPGIRYIYNFNYKAPLSYSVNMMWDVSDFLKLRASVAKGFRAPSIKELYLNFQDINHNITGNPDLEAETGNNFNCWIDLGFDKESHRFQISNNLYYNKIQNKIELLYDPYDPTAAVYFNVPAGAVISKGFSSDFTYRLHPRLTLNSGIYHNAISTIVNTKDFTRSTDYTANFKYKNVKYRFELSVFYKFTDRYNHYIGEIDLETGEVNDVSLAYLDSYHNMDATFTVPLFNSSVRFTTGVKNIFDNKSIASKGGVGAHSGGAGNASLLNWGRTYFLKASYNFNKFFK